MKNFKLLAIAFGIAAIGLISFKKEPVVKIAAPYFNNLSNNANLTADNSQYFSNTDLTEDTAKKKKRDTSGKPPTDTVRFNIK